MVSAAAEVPSAAPWARRGRSWLALVPLAPFAAGGKPRLYLSFGPCPTVGAKLDARGEALVLDPSFKRGPVVDDAPGLQVGKTQ